MPANLFSRFLQRTRHEAGKRRKEEQGESGLNRSERFYIWARLLCADKENKIITLFQSRRLSGWFYRFGEFFRPSTAEVYGKLLYNQIGDNIYNSKWRNSVRRKLIRTWTVPGVRARRSDGGERVTNAGKTRGAFSPRFFFPRQFFSRALLSERDMISFKDTTIVNQLELTLSVPSLTWVIYDVKKDKGGRTKHNFVHKWKSFLNFIYVR